MFPIVEPSVVTTAATTGPSASLCPATGPLPPLRQMETNNAHLAEPVEASSTTVGKKPRINWVGGELDEKLAVQVRNLEGLLVRPFRSFVFQTLPFRVPCLYNRQLYTN